MVMVELNGVCIGLIIVWNMGYPKTCLESNYVDALELIKNGCLVHHPCFQLIRWTKDLLATKWEVQVHHAYKDINKVAKFLRNGL